MRLFTLYLGSLRGQAPALQEVSPIVGRRFKSFTLMEAQGVFQGVPERMWLISIATPDTEAVVQLAAELRAQWQQDGVGIECAGDYYRVTAQANLQAITAALHCPKRPDRMNS